MFQSKMKICIANTERLDIFFLPKTQFYFLCNSVLFKCHKSYLEITDIYGGIILEKSQMSNFAVT